MNTASQPAIHHVTSGQWARSIIIASLPLATVFLGGSSAKWAEGLTVAAFGAFAVVQPPRRSLGLAVNLALLATALCGAVSFLPENWFPRAEWQNGLADAGITTAGKLTAQPWITFGCFVSMIAALCWLYRVAAQQLELRVARFQLRFFAVGIIFIALLSILSYFTHRNLPFWTSEFGPFPNGGESGDVFAITAPLVLAAGQDDIRYGRRGLVLWLVGLAIIAAAVFLSSSKSAMIILLGGSGVWMAIVALRVDTSNKRHVLTVWLAVLSAMILLGVTALLIIRNEFWQHHRLVNWETVWPWPWFGVGLGNFEPLSPVVRNSEVNDWFWAAAELGVFAIGLFVLTLTLLGRRIFPLEVGSNHRFRVAAGIGALLIAIRGFVDTGLHEPALAYVALFLLGLSLHRPRAPHSSKITPWVYRLVCAALVVVGLSWTIASAQTALLPGCVGVGNAKRLATFSARGRNYAQAIALSTRALGWAPLDRELYIIRANAEVARGSSREAVRDFRRARFLQLGEMGGQGSPATRE